VKLVVQPEAEADITNAALWYDERSKAVRQKFLQTIEAALAVIGQHPHRYQQIRGSARRAVLRGFPYVLIYVASEEEVNVIACFHCSRDPRRWQDRIR
jgi:plasmid stabilization system protein ParE